jgi:hypothetical protein
LATARPGKRAAPAVIGLATEAPRGLGDQPLGDLGAVRESAESISLTSSSRRAAGTRLHSSFFGSRRSPQIQGPVGAELAWRSAAPRPGHRHRCRTFSCGWQPDPAETRLVWPSDDDRSSRPIPWLTLAHRVDARVDAADRGGMLRLVVARAPRSPAVRPEWDHWSHGRADGATSLEQSSHRNRCGRRVSLARSFSNQGI